MKINKCMIHKKKGLCILEPLCALAVLSIFIVYLSNIQIKTFHLKKYNEYTNKYIQLSENLKNDLKYNCSYKELQSLLLKDKYKNKLYINKTNLNIDSIKDNNITNLMSTNKLSDMPYAQITIKSMEEGVIRVDIDLKIECNGKVQNIDSYFYKGEYYT